MIMRIISLPSKSTPGVDVTQMLEMLTNHMATNSEELTSAISHRMDKNKTEILNGLKETISREVKWNQYNRR